MKRSVRATQGPYKGRVVEMFEHEAKFAIANGFAEEIEEAAGQEPSQTTSTTSTTTTTRSTAPSKKAPKKKASSKKAPAG